MRLTLTRDVFGPTFTLGRLSVTYDGLQAYGAGGWKATNPRGPLEFGFVVEDVDRGLDAHDSASLARKVKGVTAIPTGVYTIKRTWSPRFKRDVMQLLAVPGFAGIRVHSGNRAEHSEGCLLPGLARDEDAGTVSQSKAAVEWLDARVQECERRGEAVSIEIRRGLVAGA